MNDFRLSDEQRLVVTSEKKDLLVIAPPGCGKTEVLAHRAAKQIDSLERNQKVLALTFTNRARLNLEERLRSVLGYVRGRRQVVVRNFHGFATEIVLSHGRTIGLNVESIKLPRTNTLRQAIEEAGAQGNAVYRVEQILSEIKRNPFSDAEVIAAIHEYSPEQEASIAISVERSRQAANQLHYNDLLRHAQRLLRIPAIARLYQAHFGAVLVDEFQDLSVQQLELALLSCTSRRTFAGDPLQGIYSWAGAAPKQVEDKIRQICGGPVRLHESYRSSPKVLEAVNSISELIDPDSKLTSTQPEQWPGGGCTASLVFQDRVIEANTLTNLAKIILERSPQTSIGIISRAGWRREIIDAMFANEKSFPVRRWDLAIDDPEIVSLVQSTVAALPLGTTIAEAKSAVLDVVDPADIETHELIDDAFNTLERTSAATVKMAVQAIKVADPKQVVGPGVHLLNAHTGKGQQFDWIFLIGIEEGHVPGRRNSHGDALAEEQRVLLVMLSRARHGLVITRTRQPSRWWSEIRVDFSSLAGIETYLDANL